MTMTRQQLEDVIDRQLAIAGVNRDTTTIDASRRAILAAVDDWAASQVAAAITPPAVIHVRGKLTRRTAARIRAQLARAPGTTTGGTP